MIKTFNLREAIFLKSECRFSLRTEENRSPDSQIRGSGFFNWWELRWLVKKWYIYCQLGDYMGVSKNSGIPKWMVKKMENPIKMDDLGVPLFSENIHMPPTTFYRNQKQPLRIRSIFWGSAHCVNTPRHMKPLKMGWFQECFGLLHSVVPIADGFSGNFLGRCTCG